MSSQLSPRLSADASHTTPWLTQPRYRLISSFSFFPPAAAGCAARVPCHATLPSVSGTPGARELAEHRLVGSAEQRSAARTPGALTSVARSRCLVPLADLLLFSMQRTHLSFAGSMVERERVAAATRQDRSDPFVHVSSFNKNCYCFAYITVYINTHLLILMLGPSLGIRTDTGKQKRVTAGQLQFFFNAHLH